MLTTRERIEWQCRQSAAVADKPVDERVLQKWVDLLAVKAADRGDLVTEQQIQDHVKGRFLQLGDECVYVGPDRSEALDTDEAVMVPRPHRQHGRIAKSYAERDGDVFVFRPSSPQIGTDGEEYVVDLIVRAGTASYWLLERLPTKGHST